MCPAATLDKLSTGTLRPTTHTEEMNHNSYSMNSDSQYLRANSAVTSRGGAEDTRPILIVPYMWIGDFVRCHSVVKVLRQRFPDRPVDLLATSLCAPLVDYMPGVRQVIVADLPRSRLALSQQNVLAERLKREGYGTALTMP
jgi:heptosyltransferase II